MLCRATQDGQVMVESSGKKWSTGEGNGKALQYSCLENTMNSMKRQKDMTLNDELPRSFVHYDIGEERKNRSTGIKRLTQSRNNTQFWMCLVVKIESNAVKNNIA